MPTPTQEDLELWLIRKGVEDPKLLLAYNHAHYLEMYQQELTNTAEKLKKLRVACKDLVQYGDLATYRCFACGKYYQSRRYVPHICPKCNHENPKR